MHSCQQRINEVIKKHYTDEEFNVNRFSKLLHIDRVTLYRWTKKYYKKTPHTLIEDYRIEKAKQMLTNNEFMIKHIAYTLGYTSGRHFSQIFKKKVGISPTDFRRQYLESSPLNQQFVYNFWN